MRTGDLFERENGLHTYLGRVDDMLRVGGEWVSPAEVEGVLIEHRDVLEAAVVGERDDADVTRPIAYVVASAATSPDPDELTALCRERLAGFKRPRRYEIVADLPKTATGKIQRFKLRPGGDRA
jgi:benzoate-CoA ligase